MASQSIFFVVLLLGVALLSMESNAVQYTVTNNAGTSPGGIRFTNEIGIPYTQQILDASTNFIWRTFQQADSPNDRKNTQQVSQNQLLSNLKRTVKNIQYILTHVLSCVSPSGELVYR